MFVVFIMSSLWIYASIWSFNHINAWAGIGLFILGIYISANKIFNNNKKTKE